MGLVVWSPLASGLLTGKYDDGIPKDSRLARMEWLKESLYHEANLERVRQMKGIADDLGVSRAQLALAWTASRRGVSSVITGANRMEQLEENLGALHVTITPEVEQRLDDLFPRS